ncbi:L,D-transpeptidase family protein [Congregicoccus parvus]|uniref:L,D-transpeptidase family protein n=1 Tax=Congregicoccus parvus TaxID=3081749 RepID=UPI003FA5B7BE
MMLLGGWERVIDTCAARGIKPTNRALLVSIERQTMQFFVGGELKKAYVVSTSKRPPSNIKGSLGTPRGLHAIAEKIGAGQPPGIVFKARVATGYHFTEHLERGGEDDNLITTRILWLAGLEPGVNQGGECDTRNRYVYIHGTNREDLLGTPASAGCVQMGNLDIVELFEQVRVGDPVLIVD